jgi:hypothetical protein
MQALNFVRLGLATVSSTRILTSPQLGVDWNLRPLCDLEAMHRKVIAAFNVTPYGPHEAVATVFGWHACPMLSENGEFQLMPLGLTVGTSSSRLID